jgi:hypothetical protein
MYKTRVMMVTLLIIGFVLFLVGLLAVPAGAAEGNAPPLQPSPRPTSALPTLRPTSELPTLEPTTGPSETGEPASQPDSPALTPSSALLPDAGGASGGGWLLGLGGGFILIGFLLAVLRQGRA